MAEEVERSADAGPEEEPLPGPSFLPALLALGVAVTLIGVITKLVVVILGLVIVVIALGGWIRDARHSYRELH